ncbi:MAG: bifunctional precorrin-2 dehydrogenase/sirohydrochlorin ferrochelatase [Flavobacteriaceae bacterium]|nr:bifunctional precorrin-2 dehydrogenase/sirohydrochlorin ferrochelatase [Flavobacteriaceae bacterium]
MNTLYPIFLKAAQLEFLVVGGGYVALEKLSFLYKSSPEAKVTLIAPFVRSETLGFIKEKPVTVIKKEYQESDLENKNIVIATTDSEAVNLKVNLDCKKRKILVNVADTPDQCDFYMGSIVTKGNLKIGISTNGKSPTLAKRMRQFLEDILPEEIDPLLETLRKYRKNLKNDFAYKVKEMNKVTASLIKTEND